MTTVINTTDLFSADKIETMEFEQELVDSLKEDNYDDEEISFCQFCDRFSSIGRETAFSYEAKEALYEYLTEEDECNWSYINDPIAICCDWSEHNYESTANDYYSTLNLDIDNYENEEERNQAILEGLQEYTMVIETSKKTLLIQAF